MNIDEIHQFEYWIETGFVPILAPTGVKIFDRATRPETFVAPSATIIAIVGSYIEHRHPFPQQATISSGQTYNVDAFDCYEGTLEVTVVTNRKDSHPSNDHRRLLGICRGRLLRWNVLQNWTGNVILPTDIRPIGTADTGIDDQDCDYTVLSHQIIFGVNTHGIWPNAIS